MISSFDESGTRNTPMITASWEKLTSKAKEAVQTASRLASRHGNAEVMPLHLLASLLADREGVVVPVLSKIGIDSQAILAEARHEIDSLPALWAGGVLKAEPSWAASKVLQQAFGEAAELADEHVSTEHPLLAIVALENDPGKLALAVIESLPMMLDQKEVVKPTIKRIIRRLVTSRPSMGE